MLKKSIRSALMHHESVKGCHILLRETSAIAYIVSSQSLVFEPLLSCLEEVLPESISISFAQISNLPLTESGEVNESALESIPIIDDHLAQQVEEQLKSKPEIKEVAVLVEDNQKNVSYLHLSDLLSDWQPNDLESEEDLLTRDLPGKPDISSSSKPLAISDGGVLQFAGYTLPDLLPKAAQKGTEKNIVYLLPDGTEQIQSYADLLTEAERIFSGLKKQGLKPQDKIIFQLEKNHDIIPAFWGCILGGFIPMIMEVPSTYEVSNRAFEHLCHMSELLASPLFLTDRTLHEGVKRIGKSATESSLPLVLIEELRNYSPENQYHLCQPDDIAFFCLTSGSTGMPKCVQLTHHNVITRSKGANIFNGHSHDDVNLNWLPFDHIGSLAEHIRCVESVCSMVYVYKEDILSNPLNLLDIIDKYRITHTWGPNFIYALIRDALKAQKPEYTWDLSCVKFLISGGEAASYKMMEAYLEKTADFGFPSTGFRPSFGMAEICAGITYYEPTNESQLSFYWIDNSSFNEETITKVESDHPGSSAFANLGKPIPGVAIRIVNQEQRVVPEDTIGHIQLKGELVLMGYYKSTESDREVFLTDGWFDTGDLGFISHGNLILTGRAKEMLIINGANYYSHEIEDIVEEIEEIEVSYTAACAVKDRKSDTEKLAVFFHSPLESDEELKALIKKIRQAVVTRSRLNPDYIIPVKKEDIPKTPIGKIQRTELSQRFNQGEFSDSLKHLDILLENENTLPDWFFKKVWKPEMGVSMAPEEIRGLTLIFTDQSGLGAYVCHELEKSSISVVCIKNSTEFAQQENTYSIAPDNPAHYHRLFNSILSHGQSISNVLHLWAYDSDPGRIFDEKAIQQDLKQGVYSLLFLVQALAEIQLEKETRLFCISCRSQATHFQEEIDPAKSSVLGIIKTIPHEMPWLRACHVDLPLGDPEVNGPYLLDAFFSLSKEQEVVYRDNKRLVCRFDRINWQKKQNSPFKKEGFYLITGGLGGIGVHLARFLLQNYEAKLLLIGRTPLEEKRVLYHELEQLGGDVIYEQADVCQIEQLKRVAQTLSKWQNKLDGVIHLAGTYQERLLVDETPESLDRVIGSKIRSTWLLDHMFCNNPDTLFIHFASLSGFFGGFNGAAYSAANSFLERFAHYQRNKNTNAYCISWTQWADTGMNQNRAIYDRLQIKKGFLTVAPKQGIASFASVLNFELKDMIVGMDINNPNISFYVAQKAYNLQQIKAYMTLKEAALQFKSFPSKDLFGVETNCNLVKLKELPLASNGEVDKEALLRTLSGQKEIKMVAPRNRLEGLLVEVWQEVLGIKVGVYDNFFELGGNSIKTVMVMNKLQEKVNSIFHPVSLFDAPTIFELAEYFRENYPTLFNENEDMAIGSTDQLNRDQIAHMQRYLYHSLSGKSVKPDLSGQKNKPAIFILSPARSGSTLLRVILGGHPRLFSPPELYLLSFNRLKERKEVFSGRLNFLKEGVVRAIMEIKDCKKEEADQIMEALEEKDLSVKELFGLMQSWLGDRILVDKTPPYAFNPEVLKRTDAEFENALYLHLVRHPAGMICSFDEARVDLAVDVKGDEQEEWSFSTRQKGELWWLISLQNILAFLENIPANRQHVIKFEDMVTEPEITIKRLCEFLEIDFHHDMLVPQKEKRHRMTDGAHHFSKIAGDPKFHTHKGITASAANRWKEVYQQDFLCEETWQIAKSFGYDRKEFGNNLSFSNFQVEPDLENRFQPFPLTDIQEAYWAGRNTAFELGGNAVHSYTEVEAVNLDVRRFNNAWQKMIDRHEMLRAIVLADGQQQIIANTPHYNIKILDFRGLSPDDLQSELNAIKERMSHQVLPCDKWPLFEILISRLENHLFRVHFSFDAILFDARSRYIIFSEFRQFYQEPSLQLKLLELSFRDYVLMEEQLKRSELFNQARHYWLERIPTLPGTPELPLSQNPATLKQPKFIQKNHYFSKRDWSRLKISASKAQITPSCLLLTVFSDIIRIWNKLDQFTINITAYKRLPLHAEVNDIVGDFTAVILMEIDPPENHSFIIRARALQKRLFNDFNQSLFSGVQLLREIAKHREHKPGAQMPVVFTSVLADEIQDTTRHTMEWLGEVNYNIAQTPQIWFDHIVFEEGGGLLCRWNIVDTLFPEGMMDDMFNNYLSYLKRLIKEENAWEDRWQETARKLVPPYQLYQRKAVNATEESISEELLHTLFEAQVRHRPEHPALVSSDRVISYKELDKRSNQIGHRLRNMGACPNKLVGVIMENGWEQVAAVMGILASGAAYLPIDPELPEERFLYLLEYGEIEIALTQTSLHKLIDWPEEVTCLCVDDETFSTESTEALEVQQSSEDLAYVIFTSGSTGLPKGVMIDHKGAVNTILDINKRFNVSHHDKTLALSALSFDLSVYDIFGTLAAGGTIIMPRPSDIRNPSQWLNLITENQVTIWNSVPAFMGLLTEYVEERSDMTLDSLQLILMSGDWIPLSLPEKIRKVLNDPRVCSLGGATEASIWSILYPIETIAPSWKSIPYGKPMKNQKFHVFNNAMEPCPIWVPGMLYIGGIGLARGYWRDQEKTDNSFITHPRSGERLYCTGDMGRYLPDGNIEFLGREDFQVKIQGFRVELGEIEAALAQHPDIKSSVVEAKGEWHASTQLVAYVVSEQEHSPLPDTLHRFLKQKLPDYMIPSLYIPLEELPLTLNGKIDRKALPEPAYHTETQPLKTSDGHSSELLTKVSGVVEKILGRDHVDPNDNMLNIGATSIHMMRIANQMEKELGFRPEIDQFYMNPTLIWLVEASGKEIGESKNDNQAERLGVYGVPEKILEQFDFIAEPHERQIFKERQPGIRELNSPSVQLFVSESDEMKRKYEKRRSYRRFSSQPISFADFSEFFSCMRQIRLSDKPKYLYGSAGGLYPVQTYLYIKPDRVESIEGGIYYYHPVDHRLVLLSNDPFLDNRIYNPHINRPIFEEAAFGIFLIAQLSAIVPMYQEQSLHFAVIEAGLISQLLETHAPDSGIGLCQIGELDFDRSRHLFNLDDTHLLIHSLLGGISDRDLEEIGSSAHEYSHLINENEREEEEF